uniref:hypothetical protein n=1 Tax=Leclercia adecarboxylata TaxID=83655 RepID=UPI00057A0B7B
MKTTIKLIASAVSLCLMAPGAYAITADQAAANLKGAADFEHLVHKNYAAALRAEHVSNIEMMNTINQYGATSPQAAAAAQKHLDAFKLIDQRRNDLKLAQTQLQAARNAFKDGSIAPVAIPVKPASLTSNIPTVVAPPAPNQSVPPKPQTTVTSTVPTLVAPPAPKQS